MFGKLNLLLLLGILTCLGLIFFLQRDPSEPHLELVLERQMARSPAFGAFAPNPNFPDGLTLRPPVAGTIAQGRKPFGFGATPVEAARAGKELHNPLSAGNPETRQRGAFIYGAYCQCCHGETGLGDGAVSRNRGFPAPLSFLTRQALDMPDGEMYHILTHGKGNMPAHALQLSPENRWAAIVQVRTLQKRFTAAPNVRLADTIKLFRSHCAACHGEDGTGSLLRGRLPNLPDFTSLAWQLSQTNLEIVNRIEYGDEPLMPSFRYQLTRDQILALSIYIRTFAMPEQKPDQKIKPAPLPSAANLKPVQIFRAYCLACHNVDGRGAIVRPGMPDIPDFTSAKWHESKKDAELAKAILTGGKFMPPMSDKLTQADAERMAKFVRSFKDGKLVVALESQDVPKKPVGVPEEFKDKVPPPEKKPPPESPELANRLRAAAVLFREYCLVCHGPDGAGSPAMRPALPPLPDFTQIAFQEQHSDPQLLISILDGKGTLMPANRGRVSEAQARDLVAFIRTFGPPGVIGKILPPSEFQLQFEQLQRQWEALQREVRELKTPKK
jgi:cbb3-type cytochrome c oxidase subunit III